MMTVSLGCRTLKCCGAHRSSASAFNVMPCPTLNHDEPPHNPGIVSHIEQAAPLLSSVAC